MKKLHGKNNTVLYALSGMGVNLMNIVMGSYLCSALLIGGFDQGVLKYQTYLQKDIIIAEIWGVFVLIAKIVDGVIDIPMAAFADNLKTRWGRRRPALMIGFVPMCIAYLLFLIIPNPHGVTLLNTVYYGILLIVFYSFYTLTMVTYYATFTEIVETSSERNMLANAKSVFDIVYFILGYVVVRLMLNSINIRVVALIVFPISLTMLIPMFMIKEGSNKESDINVKSVGLIKSLKTTMNDKTFILWMIVYSMMTFGIQLFLAGINEFFSFIKVPMVLVMAASFAPVPFTLLIYDKILKKHGFINAFRYALAVFSIGMVVLYVIKDIPAGTAKTALSIFGGLWCSLAMGALFSVAYSIPSQLAADGEKRTGISNSAMYFAVQGLFAGVANGIGTGIVLTWLKGSQEQSSDRIKYITLIAAAGTIAALLLTGLLPKRMNNKSEG